MCYTTHKSGSYSVFLINLINILLNTTIYVKKEEDHIKI